MITDDFLKFSEDQSNLDIIAPVIAKVMQRFIAGPNYAKYFQLWEQHGFHITPNHFYQPIPDTRKLPDSLWNKESELVGVDMNEATQIDLLSNVFPRFQEEYNSFPKSPTSKPYDFHFNNGYFDGTDALVLYCMVRHFKPRKIIESGSGFSTRVSAKAALINGNTELICIEPYPSDVLKTGFPGLTKLYENRIEDIDVNLFKELGEGDILFIDTSHVVRCGGDVNWIYHEIIPRLNNGVIVHIHDIFLPKEYPKRWTYELFRFWTEQYLLQSFLAFNSAFEVLFCNSYMGLKHLSKMQTTFPHSEPFWGGGSFWMRRKSEN